MSTHNPGGDHEMATTPKRANRSEFLWDLFERNPAVNLQEANDAWKGAGNEGEINVNTFYNYKSEFKKRSSEGSGTGGAAGVKSKTRSSSKGSKGRKAA